MFKSIFSKYLTAFTVILFCCIVIILMAVSSRISVDSYNVQRDSMQSATGSVVIVVDEYLNKHGYNSLYTDFDVSSYHYRLLDYTADSLEGNVYLFDYFGQLVCTTDPAFDGKHASITPAAISTMLDSEGKFAISTIDGFFKSNQLNTYRVVRVGGVPCIVLLSVDNYSRALFTKDIVMVTVTVSLWVFLGAMITIYVITKRTTRPLREIMDAAQSYSKGIFDRKIEVVGQDEVADLAEAINSMAESLKHLEEVRSTFLGNVSHDLRTPMTTISGFVDGIIDGTIPAEKHEYYLDIISQEVKRLSRLVNTLLEVSRVENTTAFNPEPFNLTETARTVLVSLESKISKKNIDVEFESGEEDIFSVADRDALHRVVFNLMDNAVKFTPENGKISIGITLSSDGRKKRKAVFSIKNTGEGIPNDELPHIFERFYKTDRSRGLDKSGTGLGLYIAKTVLLKHGEDITVSSVRGEYTEFVFTLPVPEIKR